MCLTATMQLSLPACRKAVLARQPVRAFSAGSAYLGRRIEHSKLLGLTQLPSRQRGTAATQRVQASFFGVGAPEALLVGVVALVVFGPKGLAQAAKSLGSTLRSFAPTIRELSSVSQELKSTLEQEIGINEIREELARPAVPTPRPPRTDVSTSYDGEQQGAALSELANSMQQQRPIDPAQAALVDPDIERKRAEAAAAAWGGAVPAATPVAAAAPAAPASAAPAPAAAAQPRAVEAMSLEELEAELARRKSAANGGKVPQQLSADEA